MAANYFSHDSNARNDEKVIRLRMKHGAAGYGVYFMLLERMRDSKDYTIEKDYDMIAFDLRVDVKIIKSVVEDFDLFDFTEDGNAFYSKSFMDRMVEKDLVSKKRSEAGKIAMAKRWSKSNDVITNEEECYNKQITNVTENDNHKSKVNIKEEPSIINIDGKKKDELSSSKHTHLELLEKRKQKLYDNLVPFVEKYGKEMVREFFNFWTEPNKSKTKMRFELERTWDLSCRLAYWASRDYEFSKGKKTAVDAAVTTAAAKQREENNADLMKRLDEMKRNSVSYEDARNSEEYKRAMMES